MPRPITPAQLATLTNLIGRIGKAEYWRYKDALGIPRGVTLTRLTKAQAWQLVNQITTDLDLQQDRRPAGRDNRF